MYATAHRVQSPSGQEGVNAFVHEHGPGFMWPSEPWRLPEEDPGDIVKSEVEVPPGGNRICSFLDLLTPDGADRPTIDAALNGLWLELVADEAIAPSSISSMGPLPNPLVYRRGPVVLRFGVERGATSFRAAEMAKLRRVLEPLLVKEREAA